MTVANYGIYHWNGSGWDQIDGGGVRIAVGSDGQPWVVNSNGSIYHRVNGAWQTLPGAANDIGVH
jgi:tectonin-like protein